MSNLPAAEPALLGPPERPRLVAALALGVAYWAAVLLALEPGNLLRAIEVGQPLPFMSEVARIAGASLLGAASAPAVLLLARRFPLAGERRRRNAAVQGFCLAALTVGLIVLSCVGAGLGPFNGSTDVPRQLVENGPLVALCLTGLAAGANAVHLRGAASPRARLVRSRAASRHDTEIRVTTRGGVVVVPLDQVDWIEAQGNYVGLHLGPTVHLIREPLTKLEKRLDPERFARVHRRTLVALDRIRELRPLPGGDAELRLADGTRLRLSRSHRDRVQAHLSGGA